MLRITCAATGLWYSYHIHIHIQKTSQLTNILRSKGNSMQENSCIAGWSSLTNKVTLRLAPNEVSDDA